MISENIIELSEGNFDKEVLQSKAPVLVDFWAEWCGPCKMLAPLIEELASEYEGRAKIGKVNIDNDQQLALNYSIQSIPTILLFKNGQVLEQHSGLKSKATLKKCLDSAIDHQED